jgi:hypothetical protein
MKHLHLDNEKLGQHLDQHRGPVRRNTPFDTAMAKLRGVVQAISNDPNADEKIERLIKTSVPSSCRRRFVMELHNLLATACDGPQE